MAAEDGLGGDAGLALLGRASPPSLDRFERAPTSSAGSSSVPPPSVVRA
jgi:hypothetical protein